MMRGYNRKGGKLSSVQANSFFELIAINVFVKSAGCQRFLTAHKQQSPRSTSALQFSNNQSSENEMPHALKSQDFRFRRRLSDGLDVGRMVSYRLGGT